MVPVTYLRLGAPCSCISWSSHEHEPMCFGKLATRLAPWLRLAACGVVAVLATGCIANKNFWLKTLNPKSGTYTVGGEYQKDGLKPPLVLTSEQITNHIVGTETNGATRVSYGTDLQPQAARRASTVAQTVRQTEQV